MSRLFVVPTPIGNLEDMTLRGLRVLGEVSLVLAEDTRHTRKLFRHYDISTPLLSYHQHNKRSRLDSVIKALSERDVALVTNAGMPVVSDPGFELVNAVIDAGFEVDVLPGPSASVTAVVAAALPAAGFVFAAFLPRRPKERRQRLAEVASLRYSLVLYEAPHRLLATLHDLHASLGERNMVVARELTKVHQEVVRDTITGMIGRYGKEEPRGEFTLVIAPALPVPEDPSNEALAEMRDRHSKGENSRSVVREVCEKYGMSRNHTYQLWLEASGREKG